MYSGQSEGAVQGKEKSRADLSFDHRLYRYRSQQDSGEALPVPLRAINLSLQEDAGEALEP